MSTPVETAAACRNCGAVLQGRFCTACGQEDGPLDPSLKEILLDLGRQLSDLDGRVFGTSRRLLFSPGFLTGEHFSGRRAAWISPIRLYLVISIVYFAIGSFTGEGGSNLSIHVAGDSDEETRAELARFGFSSEEDLERAVDDVQATWMPRVMFLLMPIFAALVQWARRRSGHHYPHHLIFALHMHSAWFAVFAVSGLVGYLSGNSVVSVTVGAAAFIYASVYFVLALRRVYGGTIARAVAHAALISAVYWIATIMITVVIIAPAVLTSR